MPIHKKNRLLVLEKKLYGRSGKSGLKPMASQRKRKARVRAQALDQEESIELTYNETTESYEAAIDEEIEAEAFDWTEEEDEDEAEAFDWEEDDETEAEAFDWDDDVDDEAEAFEVEAFEDENDQLAEDFDFSDFETAQDNEQTSQALSDDDFAADLHAIFNGEKTYDSDRGGVVNANGDNNEEELATAKSHAPQDTSPQTVEAEANPHDVFSQMSEHMPHNKIGDGQSAQVKSQATEADERPHDVFDRMGHNMSYANSFDLGSISMEQRFEELDEAIDREDGKISARARTIQKNKDASDLEISEPLALNEAVLVDDLNQMHEAMAYDDDVPGEDKDIESSQDHDESNQAIQLSIDAVGYVTKTADDGAYLHPIESNEAGNITSVKKIQKLLKNRTRIPTGAQVLVDTGKTKTKDEYIWAHYNNKTGAIRKSSIVVLTSAAVPATVVRSDVKVTDAGIQEQQGTKLYSIKPEIKGGKITTFLEIGEIKTLALGTKILVQPATRSFSTTDVNLLWAICVDGKNTKVGAVNRNDVMIENQLQTIPPIKPFSRFFEACWTIPWLKALFRGFSRTLYNAENLDFLSAVSQIRNQAQAQHVVDLFVRSGSNREVNVSGGNRKKLVDAITNPPPNGYPDWRIPFGYDEQQGTTFLKHLRPANAACKEIYRELAAQRDKPEMGSANDRKKYIDALIKDPNG